MLTSPAISSFRRQATLLPAPKASKSGTFESQISLYAGHRGAKAQPGGKLTGDGGEPAIETRRCFSFSSTRGIERSNPIV